MKKSDKSIFFKWGFFIDTAKSNNFIQQAPIDFEINFMSITIGRK